MNMTPTDFFCVSTAIVASLIDVSEIADGEICTLCAESPPIMNKIDQWDRKLKKVEPVHGDIGINNKRESFWYTHTGEWRAIS